MCRAKLVALGLLPSVPQPRERVAKTIPPFVEWLQARFPAKAVRPFVRLAELSEDARARRRARMRAYWFANKERINEQRRQKRHE